MIKLDLKDFSVIGVANEFIFLLHIFLILSATLGAFLIGKSTLQALVCLFVVCANIFVVKQMPLYGITACGGGMYIVGSMCGLLLLQEFYGEVCARRTVFTSFALSFIFLILGLFQMAYIPHAGDTMHGHFKVFLLRVPLVTLVSLGAHAISQGVALLVHGSFKRYLNPSFAYNGALILGQIADSALFFGGVFWGEDRVILFEMIGISILIKTSMVLMSSFLIVLAHRYYDKERGGFEEY